MKRIVIALMLLIIIGLTIYFCQDKATKQKATVSNNIQIMQFEIEERTILKKDNAIYVGNNLKEVENNFYDIKILNTQDGIVIYLNKLWYEAYGKDYIQDDYLARICRELSNRLQVENNAEQFEYVLYKYIKDNYVKVRQNEVIEKITTDKFNLSFGLEDNVVKLIIQRGN